MTRIINGLKQRRLGRRWQHWSEVDPLEDYERRARIGAEVAAALFLLLAALVVIGFVIAR